MVFQVDGRLFCEYIEAETCTPIIALHACKKGVVNNHDALLMVRSGLVYSAATGFFSKKKRAWLIVADTVSGMKGLVTR